MRFRYFIVLILILSLNAKANALKDFARMAGFATKDSMRKRLLEKEVISYGYVRTQKNIQTLKAHIFTLHPKNCTFALKKLSQYEKLQDYIDFVKISKYNEKTKKLYFYLNHNLMPFPMTLKFELARMTGPGDYPYTLKGGMLNGLKGVIFVREENKRCFLGSHVSWSGPKTKIPDLVFEVMAQTLAEKALQKLVRISSY